MILATAGHIDHGKTALVRALTGVDADRLPEEKRRGLTIDLGFAYASLPDGTVLGFVDVPGHERFIHNMLAGATGIDFVLIVVAADDGVMPQTIEHLAILDLLGIEHGIVALTKADLADRSRRAEVTPADAKRVFGRSALAVLPADRHAQAAQDRGKLLSPRGRIGRAAERLARSLLEGWGDAGA